MRTCGLPGLLALLGSLWLSASTGCSTAPARPVNDPRTDYQDPSLPLDQRIEALQTAWDRAPAEPGGRDAFRVAVKGIAWSQQAPTELRLASIRTLLLETDPAALADARELMRMRLWQERNEEVIALIAREAAERQWVEYSGALVRSYARRWPSTPDDDRPERAALEALRPGQPIERIVLEVFLDPGEAALRTIDMNRRTRADAWDLLSRLDATGAVRMAATRDQSLTARSEDGQRVLEDLRAGARDLGVIPITGDELAWLQALRQPASRNWWAEATAAVGQLSPEQRVGLRLRHIEPLRWAAEMRPHWVDATREELLSELRMRLDGRRVTRRTAGVSGRLPERLEDHENVLTWGDALAILVVDVAAHDSGVVRSVFAQISSDRSDRTTEYGGLLHVRAAPDDDAGLFEATLFPPRPNERPADDQFIASADMIEQGVRTLAHYHFHAQRTNSATLAGPSGGDLDYADRYGVNCLVFTSVERGAVAADYYCAGGIIIDLGRIDEP